MPESNDLEAPRPTSGAVRLLRVAIARARRALLWENLWPLLAAIAVAVGTFLAASWAGLWIALPPLGRVIGLAVFALVALASLVPAIWVRIPRTDHALRRLDRSSGLAHRPATTIVDALATNPADPVADALWRAHVARAAEGARRLRAGWPRPHLAARDPFAIRALVLLAVVTTFFMAGYLLAHDQHIAIKVVDFVLSVRALGAIKLLGHALIAITCVVAVYATYDFVSRDRGQVTAAAQVPLALIYTVVAFGFASTGLRAVVIIVVQDLHEIRSGRRWVA